MDDPDERNEQDGPAGELRRRVGGTVASARQQVRDAVRAGSDALREDDPGLVDLAAAVLAVPGVLALEPGVLGDLAAHLPGRRAAGITATDDETTVTVVLDEDAPVRATATAVRDVVAGAVPDAPVRVVVTDIGTGGTTTPR